ncbi:hypothetical protein FQN57_002853 [Myotisia sp. PD_48]|nr:hypothetical protein FQN57_002853 [Myotisia sp. PD_48]
MPPGWQVHKARMERVAIPDKIKCKICKKICNSNAFSKRQLEELKEAILYQGATGISGPGYANCRSCIGPQVCELTCYICDKTKSLDCFSKHQRRDPDHARCTNCVQDHLDTEPIVDAREYKAYEGDDETVQESTAAYQTQHGDSTLHSSLKTLSVASGLQQRTNVTAQTISQRKEKFANKENEDPTGMDDDIGGGVWIEQGGKDHGPTTQATKPDAPPVPSAATTACPSITGSEVPTAGWTGETGTRSVKPRVVARGGNSNFAKVTGPRMTKAEAPSQRRAEPKGRTFESDSDDDEDDGSRALSALIVPVRNMAYDPYRNSQGPFDPAGYNVGSTPYPNAAASFQHPYGIDPETGQSPPFHQPFDNNQNPAQHPPPSRAASSSVPPTRLPYPLYDSSSSGPPFETISDPARSFRQHPTNEATTSRPESWPAPPELTSQISAAVIPQITAAVVPQIITAVMQQLNLAGLNGGPQAHPSALNSNPVYTPQTSQSVSNQSERPLSSNGTPLYRPSSPYKPPAESTDPRRPKGPTRLSTANGATPLERKWGTLFDQDGNGTERLNQFLRGIAHYLIEHYPPHNSLVITPKKLIQYYKDTSAPGDVYPWAEIFDHYSSSISRLLRQLQIEHHLIQAKGFDQRPELPGITPQGFAAWATLLIQAYPEREFERLRRNAAEMAIDNPDDRTERFPKDLSRRSFPKHADREIRKGIEDAMIEHCKIDASSVMERTRSESMARPPRHRPSNAERPSAPPSQAADMERTRSKRRSVLVQTEEESKANEVDPEYLDRLTPAQPIERERQPYSSQPSSGKNAEPIYNETARESSRPLSRNRNRSSSGMPGHLPPDGEGIGLGLHDSRRDKDRGNPSGYSDYPHEDWGPDEDYYYRGKAGPRAGGTGYPSVYDSGWGNTGYH